MPSINAINLNSIQNEIVNENKISGQMIYEIREILELPKYFPILYIIVWIIAFSYELRWQFWLECSTGFSHEPSFDIIHPIMFLRAIYLLIICELWRMNWWIFSQSLGLKWDI